MSKEGKQFILDYIQLCLKYNRSFDFDLYIGGDPLQVFTPSEDEMTYIINTLTKK